jgi:hypothetical protein
MVRSPKFKEHDTVISLIDVPRSPVRIGDSGTIVHIYPIKHKRFTYEVEFIMGKEFFVISMMEAEIIGKKEFNEVFKKYDRPGKNN